MFVQYNIFLMTTEELQQASYQNLKVQRYDYNQIQEISQEYLYSIWGDISNSENIFPLGEQLQNSQDSPKKSQQNTNVQTLLPEEQSVNDRSDAKYSQPSKKNAKIQNKKEKAPKKKGNHTQKPPQETKSPKKPRKDAHDIPQNISSKTTTLITSVLNPQQCKDKKNKIKATYQQFLKDNSATNSQLVLIYAYLFLRHKQVSQATFQFCRRQLYDYLETRLKKSSDNQDEEVRKALMVKIKINMKLADYIFRLDVQESIDFQYVKQIGQALFQGRQQRGIQKTVQKIQLIQRNMNLSKESYDFTLSQYRETSNTSTGCQVELG